MIPPKFFDSSHGVACDRARVFLSHFVETEVERLCPPHSHWIVHVCFIRFWCSRAVNLIQHLFQLSKYWRHSSTTEAKTLFKVQCCVTVSRPYDSFPCVLPASNMCFASSFFASTMKLKQIRRLWFKVFAGWIRKQLILYRVWKDWNLNRKWLTLTSLLVPVQSIFKYVIKVSNHLFQLRIWLWSLIENDFANL